MVGVARGHQRADTLKPYSQKTSQSNHTRTTALSNSMKPSHARGATQDGRVMVERSNRMWSTGEGNGNLLQYSCLENSQGWGSPWAAVYGVAQSRTRLKRLSSSSSSPLATPTFLLGFLLPWTWGISSRLLQQSAAAAPYLGRGVSPHCRPC